MDAKYSASNLIGRSDKVLINQKNMEEETKKDLSAQMKCAIGEQLVTAHLIAHGWPTVNVNSLIENFKTIDLLCQKGLDLTETTGIQVKTTSQGLNAGISLGMTCEQAADRDEIKKIIKSPWVFVHLKQETPLKEKEVLDVDFYIVSEKQMIELVYGLHQWYLYGWERRPCTESLKKSPACIRIAHILGKEDVSRFSDTVFNNPMKGINTLNEWDNIWVK